MARGWTLGIAAGLLLLVVGVAWRQSPPVDAGSTSPSGSVVDAPPRDDETPLVPALKPPPTSADGFVGSEVCAQCHAAIAESYRSHPMYRSAGRVPGENEVEDFEGQTEFQPVGNRRYRVDRSETEVVHHEFMVDARGETIDDLAVPVHVFIGSGTRGKTYAANRGGMLFESLISWFSSDGGRWNLSPGLEPLSRRNFERRVPGACIMCHAGRVANVPGDDDAFEEPLFLEAAIGCERCHGPGEKHVARQEAGEVTAGQSDSGGGLRGDSGGGLRGDSGGGLRGDSGGGLRGDSGGGLRGDSGGGLRGDSGGGLRGDSGGGLRGDSGGGLRGDSGGGLRGDSGGGLRGDSGGRLRDDSIVNPERLDPARRESVCNQCHLQGELAVPRYGRTFFDFRPGQLLDEVWTVSVEGSGVRDDGMTRAVSQVQQMRASACYQRSEGRMSCNSCHPAHSVPDPETKADYYRGRCLECHAERGCSLPEAERATPPAENSCVYCHMPRLSAHDIPHASQTDHRVGRSPTVQPPDDPNPGWDSEWELFDHAEQRLPRWEVDRVRGLNHVQMALLNRPSAALNFREAEPLLRAALRAAPDDVRVLEALGQTLFGQSRGAEARECFQRLLEIQPRHETSLEMLAELSYDRDDFDAGIAYGERLLAVNPWIATYYARQADMLRRRGQLTQSLACGEKALRLDPWQTQIRAWLVEVYRMTGDGAASARHAEFLRRMRGG